MAYDSLYTNHYRLPYFSAGQRYSGRADYERFVTLDRHLESFVGIVGPGVIGGWVPVPGNGLHVSIGLGTGLINGYFSESGWNIIPHSSVSPADVVVETAYYTAGNGTVYDKILVPADIVLPDDSECYLYAFRNSNYLQETPYPLPDNDSPIPETSSTFNASHSAVGFEYAASERQASSSGRVYVGLVRTRSGQVASVDMSSVSKLSDLDAPIRDYASYVLRGHRHGGSSPYDPAAVRLDVDRRAMVLTASYDAQYEFTAQSSDRTSVVESHSHTYYMDDSGNGVTVSLFGSGDFHYHPISASVVGNPVSDSAVPTHIHEIVLRDGENDGWDAGDAVQVYVNAVPYDGAYAVDASAKTVTFDGGITVKKRGYTITSGDWTFTSEESSLYRFMLRASIAYYTAHDGATNIILPDPATPVSELKLQAVVGEYRLSNEGDVFTFVSPAASNLAVTLSSAAHVDTVDVEILTNSEVQGRLPQDNILYIPASKIASGKFSPERIPMLSHVGRFIELAEPVPTRLRSVDGRIYEIPSDSQPTDAKTVYAVCDDGAGNILFSTSDGLWMAPQGGAYLFSVNGVYVKTSPGDMASALAEAVSLYTRKTGVGIVTNGVYDEQVASASLAVSAVGDTYFFVGGRNPSAPGGVDRILLSYVASYRLTDYGYEAVRTASDIKPGEVVVEEIVQEEAEDGTKPDPLYRVANNFNRHTAKSLSVQRGVSSGYSAIANRYFAVSSSGIFWSDDADRKWTQVDESSSVGYVYAMTRAPSGVAAMSSEHGFFTSISGAARGFRKVVQPVRGVPSSHIEIMPDGAFVTFSENYVSRSTDLGRTWITTELPARMFSVSVDWSLDMADSSSGHTHDIHVDAALDGWTSYNDSHTHDVLGGVVQEAEGHTHHFSRMLTVFCVNGAVVRSVDGTTWTSVTSAPYHSSAWTHAFSAFGKLYVSTTDEVKSYDGASWSLDRSIPPAVISSSPSFDGLLVHLGYDNAAAVFDGSSVSYEVVFRGGAQSSFYIDGLPARSGVYANNHAPSVDFGGDMLLGSSVGAVYDRSAYRPEQGGWKDGTGYDLYITDRMVFSTRSGIDRRTGYVAVDNVGYIYFSVSGKTASQLLVGETEWLLLPEFAASLPVSGTIRAWYPSGNIVETVFLTYSAKTATGVVLESASPYTVPVGSSAALVPYVSASDDVRITVYDGKLTNVGVSTHEEVEDALSRKDSGLGLRLSDVYRSNLLHLSVAADYAYPSVSSDFMNTFITRFEYNDIPGDPANIDRFIDRTASDLASLAIYGVDGPSSVSARLSSIVPGFGLFSGICLAASDSGLYYLDYSSLESNWIRVPSFAKVYDVMQYDQSTLYVAAEDGLYKTSDATLSSWTGLTSDSVGGVPRMLAARWGAIASDDGSSYWWNKWNGMVHQNPDLVNTIIAAGEDFLSYSDDKGQSWLTGRIYDANGSVVPSMSPVDFALLGNGSIAMCARSSAGDRYGMYVCTGTGNRWNEVFSSVSTGGTILSMSVTDRLNILMRVSFAGGIPPDGALIGREVVVGNASARIVANDASSIVAFGDTVMSGASSTFTVRPVRMNAVLEDRQRRVHVGTSSGMMWDAGGLFSYDRSRDGRITSMGNAATIVSVDIRGTAAFAVPTPSTDEKPRYRLSATLSNTVVSGEMEGWTLSFVASIPSVTVLSNSASKPDMSVDLVVSGDASKVVNGYTFTAAGDSHRLYVEYLGVIAPDELNGGYLVVAPQESEYGLPREELNIFTIERNTASYIQLAVSDLPEGYSFASAFSEGESVYCTYADGTVPMSVEFDTPRTSNELSGNGMEFNGVEYFPESGKLSIASNDETVVRVAETYTGIDASGSSAVFSVFNTAYGGADFTISGVPLVPMPSFKDAYSSWHAGHRHAVRSVTGPLVGLISSIDSSTASSVEFGVSGVWQLADPWLASETELFKGAALIAYDPAYPLLRHRLTVVSHTSSSIVVAREDSKIDISGDDHRRVGPGYGIYLSATGYGRTTSTEYDGSFIASSPLLLSDALSGTASVQVASPAGFVAGCRVTIESNRQSFDTIVSGVVGDVISLSVAVPHDFLVSDVSRAIAYFRTFDAGSSAVTADLSYGDTELHVLDSSDAQPGDVVEVFDKIGGRYSFVATSVSTGVIGIDPSPWMLLTISSPRAVFMRESASWPHDHSIASGQFSTISSDARASVGDDLTHGHYLAPLIDEVLGVGTTSGTIHAVGSSHRIFSSYDNGETWRETFDLEDSEQFRPLPDYLSGVYPLSPSEVAFSTSAGYYVYQSDRYINQTGSSSSASSSSMSSSSSSMSSSSFSSSSSSSSGSPWDDLDGGLPDTILEDVFDGASPDTVLFDIEIDGGLEV
jgi:hypothetical protein